MIDIFYIVLPIYLAIALGVLLVKTKAFRPDDMRILGRFVLNVAFPALIFHALVTRPLQDVFNPDYMLAYAVAGVVTVGASFVVFGAQGWDAKTRAAGVMGASCPNNGFVGYAFFLLAMPDLAPVILTLNLIVENLLIVPICLMILRGAETEGRGGIARLGEILLSVLKTPLILAMLAGTFVNISGLWVPAPLLQSVGIVAASASAIGLVVIGGALASLPPGTNVMRAGQVVAMKIVGFPAVAFGTFALLSLLGWVALTPEFYAALILSAGMPSFVIYVVFVQRLNLEGFASLVLLGTTASAFVSLSLLLAWLT